MYLRLKTLIVSNKFIFSVTTYIVFFFFFSSRRRHTRLQGDWSSDVCSSDLSAAGDGEFAIDVRDLTKRYGPRTVVDHVSLQVRSGRICGFLGPNGSGKTTKIGRASCRERV